MSKPLSERLFAHADAWPTAYGSDRENVKLLREAAALARRVEGADVAIGSRDKCTEECTSIIMHLGNGARAINAQGRWFRLVPVQDITNLKLIPAPPSTEVGEDDGLSKG